MLLGMSGNINRKMGHIHLEGMIGIEHADLKYLKGIPKGSSDEKSDFNRF